MYVFINNLCNGHIEDLCPNLIVRREMQRWHLHCPLLYRTHTAGFCTLSLASSQGADFSKSPEWCLRDVTVLWGFHDIKENLSWWISRHIVPSPQNCRQVQRNPWVTVLGQGDFNLCRNEYETSKYNSSWVGFVFWILPRHHFEIKGFYLTPINHLTHLLRVCQGLSPLTSVAVCVWCRPFFSNKEWSCFQSRLWGSGPALRALAHLSLNATLDGQRRFASSDANQTLNLFRDTNRILGFLWWQLPWKSGLGMFFGVKEHYKNL